MIILDTNVISALMRASPEPTVVAWLDRQPPESIWTTAITVFEIRYGLSVLPPGQRRESLEEAFDQALKQDFEGRVLDFDATASVEAALLAARLRAKGRPVEIRDALIAGIVTARRGALATRNIRHFIHAGIPLINPWEDQSS